jgi:DNA processing protein
VADRGQILAPDLETQVALSLLRLGSDTRAARLFRDVVTPELLTGHTPPGAVLERLAAVIGLTPGERSQQLSRARTSARSAIRAAGAHSLTILSVFDTAYPALLRAIPDPPIVLWVRGDPSTLNQPAVAIVGSRNGSPSGLEISRRFGRELGQAGVVVISGLARGIDAAAHRGSLESGCRTVAVLGNGTDVAYPREHERLAAEIASSGAVVSEFPPETRPCARHFPLRNRIISGLSRAVLVVEASDKSGSLITARAALEQGRDVLAVPGNIASGRYRGCHALIKDGARLVETVDDILDEIGWTQRHGPQRGIGDNINPSNGLASLMTVGDPVTVDQLVTETGRSAAEWLAELAELEIAGKVARTAGGAFVRLDGSVTNRER